MSSPVSKKRKWVWVSIGQALSQLVLPLKHQEVLLPPLFPSFIPPALGEIASSQSTCTSPPREKTLLWPFPGGSDSKDPPAMRETWVQSLGWDDPLEREMVTHSSILAWRILWTDESGRLQSMRLQKSGTQLRDWTTLMPTSFIYYLSSSQNLCKTGSLRPSVQIRKTRFKTSGLSKVT